MLRITILPTTRPQDRRTRVRRASGDSVEDATTWPTSSRRRRRSPRSQSAAPSSISAQANASAHAAIIGQSRVVFGQLPFEPGEIVHRGSARRGLVFAVPHQHHQVVQGVVQPALAFDHALQHHRIAAGIQEASQPAAVFAPPSRRGPGVELHVRHEAQARDRQPAIPVRRELRQEVAIADRAPALHAGVQAAQAEDQADETDAGEDVEEEPEERESDERGASATSGWRRRRPSRCRWPARRGRRRMWSAATSNMAMTYLSHAGGARIALPAISASVASAMTSTPGITGSTGVGLASLSPEAV